MTNLIVFTVLFILAGNRGISCECGINRLFDIVLVVDDSGSVNADGFNAQIAFAQSLATKLYVDENSVNFAYVLNNNAAEFQFGLREHLSYSDLETAFAAATARDGASNVGTGFIYAYEDILQTSMRTGASGYVIQISDFATVDAAGQTSVAAAKAAGINIFTIGVGIGGTDVPNMATTSEHSFSISSFDDLLPVADSIVDVICPYFCDFSYYTYADIDASFSSVDVETGKAIQLGDKAYAIECCGTASALEFYAVAAGTFQFQVWRSDVLAAKIDVTVTASDVNTIVNFTFTSDESMAIISGDYFGWYWASTNPIGYKSCSDDLCLSTSKLATTGNVAVDSSYDWSSGLNITGKAYGLKIHTTNNSEPTFDLTTTEKSLPDHTEVGSSVMDFSFSDTDVGEVFTYTVSDTYFDINGTDNIISVKSTLPHSGQQTIHSVSVIGEDSCQHFVTGTVTITTYNEPPTFTNLPDEVAVSDDIEGGSSVFTVSVTDLSAGDTVTCSLSKTTPRTTFFTLGTFSNGSADITLTPGASLDYEEVPDYQIFIYCSDTIDAIDSILTVALISSEVTTPYILPAWTVAAISVSLTAMMFVMVIICFLLVVIFATTDEAEVLPVRESPQKPSKEKDKTAINIYESVPYVKVPGSSSSFDEVEVNPTAKESPGPSTSQEGRLLEEIVNETKDEGAVNVPLSENTENSGVDNAEEQQVQEGVQTSEAMKGEDTVAASMNDNESAFVTLVNASVEQHLENQTADDKEGNEEPQTGMEAEFEADTDTDQNVKKIMVKTINEDDMENENNGNDDVEEDDDEEGDDEVDEMQMEEEIQRLEETQEGNDTGMIKDEPLKDTWVMAPEIEDYIEAPPMPEVPRTPSIPKVMEKSENKIDKNVKKSKIRAQIHRAAEYQNPYEGGVSRAPGAPKMAVKEEAKGRKRKDETAKKMNVKDVKSKGTPKYKKLVS